MVGEIVGPQLGNKAKCNFLSIKQITPYSNRSTSLPPHNKMLSSVVKMCNDVIESPLSLTKYKSDEMYRVKPLNRWSKAYPQ